MEIEVNRKRAPNFTRKETELLRQLVNSYKLQNEEESIDNPLSYKAKAKQWNNIATQFNAHMGRNGIFRSPGVLKTRYDNIRKLQRKKDHIKNLIRSSVKTESEISNVKVENGMEDDSNEVIQFEFADTEDGRSEEHFKSDTDRSPEHTSVQSPMHLSHSDENSYNEPGLGFSELQKKYFLEQHKLKMKQMHEKHKLELEHMKLEHQKRMNMLTEEHETKLEMLDLEKSVMLINKM